MKIHAYVILPYLLVCVFVTMAFFVQAQNLPVRIKADSIKKRQINETSANPFKRIFKSKSSMTMKKIDSATHQVKTALKLNRDLMKGSPIKVINIIPIKNDSSMDLSGKDSILLALDSLYFSALEKRKSRMKSIIKKEWKSKLYPLVTDNPDSIVNENVLHQTRPQSTKPLLSITGGYIDYSYNYRANIDTPFAQKDISLHNLVGVIDFTLAHSLPFKANYLLRKSNSPYFKNIADVQLTFDVNAYRNKLIGNIQDQNLQRSKYLYDSLLEKLYQLKHEQLNTLNNWLLNPLQEQKVRGYNEIIQLPSITNSSGMTDSMNLYKSDSLRNEAKKFIALYKAMEAAQTVIQHQTDSLKNELAAVQKKIQVYKDLSKANIGDYNSYKSYQSKIRAYQLDEFSEFPKYNPLLNIQRFSIGKSPVNYSELTVKNLSVNGINFEYNSWYYAALVAGIVDYRFRDFVFSPVKQPPQYMSLSRIGIGNLHKNFFILSYYTGKKQLFPSLNSRVNNPSTTVRGVSAEVKYSFSSNVFILAEGAESISSNPTITGFNPEIKSANSNTSNKALSIKTFAFFPDIKLRIESMYKYSGANFQSFSTYQTNSTLKTWFIKAEEKFMKGKLRVNGSLRSNELTNPYILQDYKSNTIFKALNLSFHAKKWPSFSLGYLPMSQLTVVDKQIVENKFQTLTATAIHFYKLGTERTATTLVFNKSFNEGSDSGFVYYRSTNVYGSQNFFFKSFTANIAFSMSKSRLYEFIVLDNGINIIAKRFGNFGFGVKVHSLNTSSVRGGGYLNSSIRITKQDMLYLSFEDGYLPSSKGQLISNRMGNIQFTKFFNR